MVLPDCFFKKLMYGIKHASWYFPIPPKFHSRDHIALKILSRSCNNRLFCLFSEAERSKILLFIFSLTNV